MSVSSEKKVKKTNRKEEILQTLVLELEKKTG